MTELGPAANNQSTILVVDDDDILRSMLGMLLSTSSYGVLEARNGQQALALLEREVAACILLDVMMPEMDGFEVCRRVKSNPASAHIPVILVTALVDEEQRQHGFAVGADDFVNKPIDARRLLTAIQQTLSHSGKNLSSN
jgi:two-component system cell cycle response regulator